MRRSTASRIAAFSDFPPLPPPRPRAARWQVVMAHGHYVPPGEAALHAHRAWRFDDAALEVTGAGTDAFCAGRDVKFLAAYQAQGKRTPHEDPNSPDVSLGRRRSAERRQSGKALDRRNQWSGGPASACRWRCSASCG